MARTYAKILLSIWDDESDFDELPMDAQWLYWVLLSHPLLSPAGVLPLQPRKWAKRAPETIADTITNALAKLVEARKVVVDEDTEEVWIRTFIRHDGGARNPNIHKAIAGGVARIESRQLRDLATVALARASQKDQRPDPDEHHPPDRPEDPDEEDAGRHPEPTYDLDPSTYDLQPASCDPSSADGFNSEHTLPDDEPEDIRIKAAINAIVTARINGSPKGDKPAYKRAVTANVTEDHLAELQRLANKYPTAPADVLAACAQGDKHSLAHYPETEAQ
jgi:hypothetical protein